MRSLHQLHGLFQLAPPAPMQIHSNIKHEPPPPQQLHALHKVLLQHHALRLVLQQIPEPLHLPPRRPVPIALTHLLDIIDILPQHLRPRRHRRPRHNPLTQPRIARLVALARPWLTGRNAREEADLGERVLPSAGRGGVGLVVGAVCFEEDEAGEQVVRGRGGGLVLSEGALAPERVVRAVPG